VSVKFVAMYPACIFVLCSYCLMSFCFCILTLFVLLLCICVYTVALHGKEEWLMPIIQRVIINQIQRVNNKSNQMSHTSRANQNLSSLLVSIMVTVIFHMFQSQFSGVLVLLI